MEHSVSFLSVSQNNDTRLIATSRSTDIHCKFTAPWLLNTGQRKETA